MKRHLPVRSPSRAGAAATRASSRAASDTLRSHWASGLDSVDQLTVLIPIV